MDTTKLTSLERAVYGTNLINKLTIENVNKIIPQLQQFLNKKIELANGSKAKNFVIELHTFEDKSKGQNLRSYLSFEYNILFLNNDVTVKDRSYNGGGYGVTYHKKTVKLGGLKDGVLTYIETINDVINQNELTKVFDAKKVKKTKDKIDALKSEVSKLESSIYQFKNQY